MYVRFVIVLEKERHTWKYNNTGPAVEMVVVALDPHPFYDHFAARWFGVTPMVYSDKTK